MRLELGLRASKRNLFLRGVNTMNQKYLRKIYKLWIEYLKRSDKYKEYCVEIKRKPASNEKEFVRNPTMGINYSIFGDVHTQPLEDILSSIEDWNIFFTPIYDYSEFISDDIDLCTDHFKEKYNREPNIEEMKTFLINLLSNPSQLYLRIDITNGTVEEITEAFEKRLKIYKKETLQQQRAGRKKLFMNPSTRIREDELYRYLQVYDLSHQGLEMKEIIKKMEPSKDNTDVNIQRTFYRDLENAKNIIRNVENCVFPGEYSN